MLKHFENNFSKEFGAILDSSLDGIHITDKHGVTIFYNKICEEMEGISKETILGKNMLDLVNSGIFSNSVALEVINYKKVVSSIQKVNNKDVLAKGVPIFIDGELSNVVVYSRDITHLNELKKELSILEEINNNMKNELINLKNINYIDKEIIAKSATMNSILDICIRIANFDSTVMITGESGVGKGVLSKFIHNNSQRCNEPFIKIDCGVIPEALLESELFGYEKGAFTGANQSGKIGLIELANKGTLFLDEIGEVPLHIQSKLLNLIQDREFYRVGGNKKVPVDIRIITATNKNLEDMVRENKFREDLFYRINVIPIHILPLRDRKDDILPMIDMFINKFNEKYSLNKKIAIKCQDILLNYTWPGNVRELENIIERLVVTSKSETISVNDIPANILNTFNIDNNIVYSDKMSLNDLIDDYEKSIILKTKERCSNTLEMSNLLKVDRSTIRRKMNKYNIEIEF